MKDKALVTYIHDNAMVTLYEIEPRRIRGAVHRYRVSTRCAEGQYHHVFCPTAELAERHFELQKQTLDALMATTAS